MRFVYSIDKLLWIMVFLSFLGVFLGIYVSLIEDKPQQIPFGINLNYIPPNE